MGFIKLHANFHGTGAFLEQVDEHGNSMGGGAYMSGYDLTSTVWHVMGSQCGCGSSDGTVDCACGTAIEFYDDAVAWLDDNDGIVLGDPGYFC